MKDIISFDKIDKFGPQSFKGSFAFSASDLGRVEAAEDASVSIEASVEKGEQFGEYVATGVATTTLILTCARCVDTYPFANTAPFHVRFRPRPEGSGENDEVEITEEGELDVEYYSEREIPLRDLAMEQIQLAIPMKPLCNDKCLGLCPQCGANLNGECCSCAASIVDERWDALRGFRDELAKKKEN
ncbi:MAG: DUF177 domain-containing protein [Acidobacteriota bacterium]